MGQFKIDSAFEPAGDQPKAIDALAAGIAENKRYQTLLGVTGSGKTFTMANVVERVQRPALVISHNKTLAAQLYEEFKELFPDNAVEYFVSYYDYYQPEAYIPQRDIYIEKDASINEEIDRLRLSATSALMTRRDVIIVASVSCIYGLGSPEDYRDMTAQLEAGQAAERDEFLSRLVAIHYERNAIELRRGTFRAMGDVVEVFPAYEEFAYRVEFFGDTVERISVIDPLTGEALDQVPGLFIYPAKHYVMPGDRVQRAIQTIEEELGARLDELRRDAKLLEAQRLEARTRYDIEMFQEMGYCSGIENYSRHLSGRPPGSRPDVLLDYFPDDFLLFIDESHVTLPQIRGMYAGDQSRKGTLVEHGFRLPSALDNRPMRQDEFMARVNQCVFVSATPNSEELELAGGRVVEQIIRPTGLVDPAVRVESAADQVPHLLGEIRKRVEVKERVLVTTLTKRLAEELARYIDGEGFACKYLHCELDAIERVEILRDLRKGDFDVLVGVNLLREGLDLPEVSLVAILDADKEGFLRSETSLVQTIGRTARNVNAEVILYADRETDSMKRAMEETSRRRVLQDQYNQEHNITPQTIRKEIRAGIEEIVRARRYAESLASSDEDEAVTRETINELEHEMLEAAEGLEFEQAAEIRDRIRDLKKKLRSRGKISRGEMVASRRNWPGGRKRK